MRSPALRLGLAAALLVVAGCGSPGAASDGPQGTASAAPSSVAATASPGPSPTRAGPTVTGDAATNAACQLASVAEIETQVGAGVKEMKGLTGRGAYADTSLSCAWYLDSQEIGIPSVVLQWEFPVTSFHDPVVDLYRMIVDQGLATAVEGIGDMAILQGTTAETVAGENIVRVSVLQHVEPTTSDTEDAVALLRLILERAENQ